MSLPEPDPKDIFAEALRLTNPADRAAYLDQACAGNPALRQEVKSLLTAYEKAGDFLDHTIPLPKLHVALEHPGTMIGRYKLLEQIGEGGFGVVYMAEQTEPVQRKVALKIIKPGMDTRAVIARFEAERQALALMDHPNIAKVLDAGAIEAGRPYFVMELVRGIPITDYCDQKALSTTERLQLFIQVCHAVQHAHQKAIIHRDLKPSNVLVTLHDGVPVPKVIDFGVAKALGQKLTAKTLFTGYAQMLGTPAYMSPEQAELSALDIDTRSDIYSLGVLLYELLTGVTPFGKETLARAALDEVRRIIRETEPPKPSTRLQTLGDQLVDVAKHRHAEPATLSRLMRGDLDWIVMKCLEKDRARRYETANSVAEDLERHLQDEPVVAGPPTVRYQVTKFVRKHRRAVAVGAGFIALLAAAAVAGTVLAVWANRERDRADTFAKKAEGERQRAEEKAAAEARARAEADGHRARAVDLLNQMRIRRAEDLFSADQAAPAIASLAQVLRQDPSNRVAAIRLMAALTQRDFSLPVCPPLRHTGDVRYAEFSPDGQRVVTASNDKTARVWDARTGQALTPPLADQDRVLCAQFNPDGQRVVTASLDGTARVWDARTGKSLSPALQHAGPVKYAEFSPDGQWVVTASNDETARVWDARTGKPVTPALQHDTWVEQARFSPDGQRVVTAAQDRTARVWDARTGQPLLSLPEHGWIVHSAEFSPDGQRILTVSAEGTARVWDARTGRAMTPPLKHQSAQLNFAQFSPDGQRVVTAGNDETARIWGSFQGSLLTSPMRMNGRVLYAAFSPDGQRVVTTCSMGAARVWDVHTGQPLAEPLRHEGRVYSAQFSSDGQRVVTASEDGTARIWDVRPGRALAALFSHDQRVAYAQFNPDGHQVQTLTRGDRVAGWIWDARTGQCLQARREYGSYVAHWSITDAAYARLSPDGQLVVTISGETEARVWDAHTGQPVTAPLRHAGEVLSVQFSPDGQWVVTAALGATRVWDAHTGQPVTAPLRHNGRIVSARFSADGQCVVTASDDKAARVWDAQTGKPLSELLRHREPVVDAQLSPHEKLVVIVTRPGSAWIWDWSTSRRVAGPMKHDSWISAVEFSPDGQRVVTASLDRTARIWDAHTGQALTEPLRHTNWVVSARFDPAGQKVVTASWDQTARVWDIMTGLPLAEPFRHGAGVGSAEFSSDGQWIVTAWSDGTARIWETPAAPAPVPPWLLDLAEALAGQRVDEQGVVQSVRLEELLGLMRRLTNSPASDHYTRWARWFLADRAARTISPFSGVTVPTYVQRLLDSVVTLRANARGQLESTLECLREAARLSPTNGLVWAGLARKSISSSFSTNSLLRTDAEWFSHHAVELSPDDPHVWLECAELLRRLARVTDASDSAGMPGLQRDRARQLEKARGLYSKVIDLHTAGAYAKDLLPQALLGRCAALRMLGRPAAAHADLLRAKNIPPRDPQLSANLIDLSPYYNAGLDEPLHTKANPGNNLASLPRGLQTLADVRFDVRGLVQLSSSRLKELDPDANYPEQVNGIKVAHQCRRLHFLHASGIAVPDGTQIASFIVRPANGQPCEIPIVYGKDVRDWWVVRDEPEAPQPLSVAWTGTNAAAPRIRLFKTTWENPLPDLEVRTIDYVSKMTPAAPFLVALTVE